jgi:hypothetical protein
VHACVPEAHEYVPLWHESYWHDPVPTQEAHCPLGLQTMFVPHDVPGDEVARLPHVCEPVAQVYVPVWQALLGLVHAPPAVQDTHAPALQTMLVPHEVPSALFVRLVQLRVPELQELVPTWHGLVALVHEPPDTQAMHWPELHTSLVPHVVPSDTLPVKEHVELPVAQDDIPFWQGLLFGLQAVPAVQATHDPLLQTWLLPHVMPLAALRGLVQTDVPVEHEVVPVWHVLPAGVQPTPEVHGTHCPLLQTWLVPHWVPSATLVAPVQLAMPKEQSVVPVWQTLPPGLHCVPDWQAPHVPLLQTACIVPRVQAVPFACWPVCVQDAEPLLQSMVPVRQGLPAGRHEAPLLQATHPPSLQTSLVPQGWPLGTAVAASGSQKDEPDPHDVRPVMHWLPPGLQFEPAVQELQLPWPSQTRLGPQLCPAGALVPRSLQMSAPPAHDAEPRWQGLPPGMQGAPAVHCWQPPSAVQNLSMSHCVPGGA